MSSNGMVVDYTEFLSGTISVFKTTSIRCCYFRKWQFEFRRAENCWYIIPVFSWISLKTKTSLLLILATNCKLFSFSVLLYYPEENYARSFKRGLGSLRDWSSEEDQYLPGIYNALGWITHYCKRGWGRENKEKEKKICPFLIIPETLTSFIPRRLSPLSSFLFSLSLSLYTHTYSLTEQTQGSEPLYDHL